MQKKGGIFNIEKLHWINKEYIKLQKNNTEEKINQKLKEKFGDSTIHPKLTEILFEKIEVISDIDALIESGELDYFFNKPKLDKEKILWKEESKERAKSIMGEVLSIMEKNGENFEKIKTEIMALAEKEGKGEVLWPLRYALSGKDKSPDPFTLIDILGIGESKERIQNAIQLL